MQSESVYNYFDGNGNQYTLSSTKLYYLPVKPSESSSGSYSGGELADTTITEEQFHQVELLFTAAKNNPAIQIKSRVMMSGVIDESRDGKSVQYILRPGCEEQGEIERGLKGLLGVK